MSNNPVRLQSGDGIAITQTSNALDVNIKSGLPTGAATEQGLDDILAKLSADPATQTTLAAILAKLIAAPASEAKQDTGNTSLASIKTAVEGATPAGTNVIGKVGIDQVTANANEVVVKSITAGDPKLGTLSDGQAPVVAGYKLKRINATFTGIGATSQYDAVGTLTEIPNWATANGRGATIREIRISVNNNAIAPQFELHFFNASDATVAADNVTWTELAADYTKRAGYVIMPACAKATGSGTIDMVRAQSDDYGQSLAKEVVCAAGSTSVWLALKLLTTGISFAGSPGNTIAVAMVIEQS